MEKYNSFPIQNIKDLANDKELRYIQISDYISKELILLLNEHVFSIRILNMEGRYDRVKPILHPF